MIYYLHGDFLPRRLCSLKYVSNLWCQSMTFNNSVMVKGEKSCLDPYNESLKLRKRKYSRSLMYNSVLQTEIKETVGVRVGET